jgi:hypothetical protein
MITRDEYPVYNHRERPGMGQNYHGNLCYNCFTISIEKDETGQYSPYLFSDFLKQYNEYKSYSKTCEFCISKHKALEFQADGRNIDRSAVAKKFSDVDVDEAEYFYCPLIQDVISSSTLTADLADSNSPAKTIHAILSGGWDDAYFFEFHKITYPERPQLCSIYKEITSSRFVSSKPEQSFLTLWIFSMFHYMDVVRQSGQKVFFEEMDFDQYKSKLFDFVFAAPQVWINVIPKSPPGINWKEWDKLQNENSYPQRVDFLFIYRGKRHIVEIDDVGHYGEQKQGVWVASETKYRQTLLDTRWLQRCNYQVHRFTNDEILELYNPDKPKSLNVQGFVRLLRAEGLEPEEMVFISRENAA